MKFGGIQNMGKLKKLGKKFLPLYLVLIMVMELIPGNLLGIINVSAADLSATDETTLQDALNDANSGDTIVVANDITLTKPLTINADGREIKITTGINQAEHSIITAAADERHLKISGTNLTLDFTSSSQGKVVLDGGGVSGGIIDFGTNAEGTIKLITPHIQNCQSTTMGGGMYFSNAKKIELEGGTFIGNKTTKENGGAIRAANIDILITPSNPLFFENNTTTALGGAIHAGTINLSGEGAIEFSGNEAKSGGAIYATSINMDASDCSTFISENKATENGGAFYGTNIDIKNASFSSNTAKYGGAIYAVMQITTV